MPGLSAEDLVDLARWHSIQFGTRDAAEAAMARYERFRARMARETMRRLWLDDGDGEPPARAA